MKIKERQYCWHYDELILIDEVKEITDYKYQGPKRYSISYGDRATLHNLTEEELLKNIIPISNEEAALYRLKQ